MFDNLISSDSKKKQRAWTPLSVVASLVIVALVIVGSVYASTVQKKEKKKKKKELVTYMKVYKPKPKPKKAAPKPEPPKPKPKPKPKKNNVKGFQTLHTPVHISNKIPDVNLDAKAVNAADFSGLGAVGGTAKGKESGNGKKKGVGTYGHGGFHTVFEAVQQMPKLKGGMKALRKQVHYPASCRNAGIEGRVIVQFIVSTKGVPTNVHVVRGIGGGCDEAAVTAVKHVRFVPGRQQGRAVQVRMSLPILFRLK